MKAYDADLAYIHDTGFTRFVTKAAPGLLRLLRRFGVNKGLVVDVGCGSGIWAGELASHGYEALGVDLSPAMIRLARRHVPGAKFRVASFLDAELPPCDAVTAIGEVVNYAFDPHSGMRALSMFFDRVHASLRPGGIFVFDIVEPGQVLAGDIQKRYSEGPDWAILLEVREEAKRKVLERRIISFRRVGRLYRRSEEIHRLNLYTRKQLLAELNRVGFQAQVLSGYGRFRFTRAHAGFLARKPLSAVLT
jgi:SAM-dependent methyltransferase